MKRKKKKKAWQMKKEEWNNFTTLQPIRWDDFSYV